MSVTIGQLPPLVRLETLAFQVNASPIFRKLSALSLTPSLRQFIGSLVHFIGSRERTGILSQWAEESTIAADLDHFGRAAWADTELLLELHSFGEEGLVSKEFRTYLKSHYLAAMTAARRPLPDDKISAWIERLRLFLLIRAVEAADAGILRESHLLNVCGEIRQICELTNHPKRGWIAPIVHPVEGFLDFVDETRYRCQKTLNSPSTTDKSARAFLLDLLHLLDKNWTALRDETPPGSGHDKTPLIVNSSSDDARSASFVALADLPTDTVFFLAQGTDESQSFARADVDTATPPPAQRRQGTGVLLQTLEETQYLRHSWHRLSQHEESAFAQQTCKLLQDSSFQNRLGAALISLAMLTSNSASSVGSLPVDSDLQEDWALDLLHGQLRRMPPRFARRWRAAAEHAAPVSAWIRRLATEWRIDLSEQLLAPLKESKHKKRSTRTIGEIWRYNSPNQTLEFWFANQFANIPELERLTSPVIATMLSQNAFDRTGDHAIARLVGSSTRTGLPSACTYGAFASAEVHKALEGAISLDLAQLIAPRASDDSNAAGSELDVNFEQLSSEIDRIRRRIEISGKDPQRWVEHHNLLCALCVLALLASTGARPVKSPFESLNWIDFAARRIYVEDKHSGPAKGSRLCVLSDFAHDLLIQRFLPNLARIAQGLALSAPEFSAEINKILSGDPECRLPLFFFLRAEPVLDWIEVSESQLGLVCDGRWPLPWNLFRHIHSTQLRRWGLHPEIRDALLAHGDRGAESHGDFSWRVPSEDLKAARPLVNDLITLLGFKLPEPAKGAPDIDLHRDKDPGFNVSRAFGREARAEQRARTHAVAQRTAQDDIQRELAARPPSSLSPQDWDQIARVMLMRENGMPHSMASLRYEVFEDYLTTIWRDDGVHSRLRRRYIPMREGSGMFTEDVIGATKTFALLRKKLDALVSELPDRAPRPVLAGCLAAVDLALFSRVDNFPALTAVICNQPSVRVIRFNKTFWFEWAYRGDWADGRPVYRVPITERAAAWITSAQKSKKRLEKLPEIPEALRLIATEVAPDIGGFIKQVTKLVSQINAFGLPGTIAAVLNGRRQSSALPHADWIRTTHLCAPAAIDLQPSATVPAAIDADSEFFFRHHHHRPALPQDASSELARCRELFDGVQKQVNETKSSTDQKIAEISRLVKGSGFAAGDAPYVLAHYVSHLLKRPKKSGGKGVLQASTTLRYWYSLSAGFLDFAAGVNLTTLDDEEITELYEQIVNAAVRQTKALPDKAKQAVPSVLKEGNSRERSLFQLEDFHNFAREIYGLEDPDWSEISPGKMVGSGRPGIVLMSEYEAVLKTLLSGAKMDALSDDILSCAFVMIVCARFGLRLGEAVGLNRNDWLDVAGTVVVLARSNGTRRLKTDHSKRQVPLVGIFGRTESEVVDELLTRWDHREGTKRDSPLLPCVDSSSFKSRKTNISGRLLPLIKGVTRNPASTVHQLRHGFATRLLALLCYRTIGKGIQFTENHCLAARKLLLGGEQADRRTLWAVARMLGHASPATTLKAYIHGIDTWHPAIKKRAASQKFHDFSDVTDLDALTLDATYLMQELEVPRGSEPSESLFLRYVRYLRLRSIGQTEESACARSRLTRSEAMVIEDMITLTAHRLAGSADRTMTISDLLSGISPKRWAVLVQVAQESLRSKECLQTLKVWLPTVGANRQIILFQQDHFLWMNMFISALKLEPVDCRLIHEKRIHHAVMRWATEAGLVSFLISKEEWGPNFQLDVAVWGSPPVTSRDRIAAVPCPGRRIRTTFEFLVLWIAWVTAQTQESLS